MSAYSLLFFALLFAGCGGPGMVGRHRGPESFSGPLVLQVRFDSGEASARLEWTRVPGEGERFVRYEVQRSEGKEFSVREEITDIDDTTFVDRRLCGNTVYRYRVMAFFEEGESEHSLSSTVVEGGIHVCVNSWEMEKEEGEKAFLPVRLAVGKGGIVSVVGAGSGRVLRFDRAGNYVGALVFSSEPPACLETGVLSGPSLALDSEDYLYVAYNLLDEDRGVQAMWSKFGPDGRLIWTRPLDGLFVRHIAIDDEDRIFIESISQIQQFERSGERRRRYIVPPLLVASLRLWGDRFAALIDPLGLVEGSWQAPRLVVYEQVERRTSSLVIGRDPLSPDDRGNGLLRQPTDFAVDESTMRSFVVNAGWCRIEVFREQDYLTGWGKEGGKSGEFRFTGRLSVIDDVRLGSLVERTVTAGGIARGREGFLYVADTFNDRVQKFQP